ncbi:DUF4091 domain-containing protein [Lachnospiraceae bacterium 54-11]
MGKTEFYLVSSLEKVFPCKRPKPMENTTLSVWAGMRGAVQLVFYASEKGEGSLWHSYRISVKGAPAPTELYKVELLPSDFPSWEDAAEDENYLTHEPGLFPDLLMPLEDGIIRPIPRQYRSVWISFPVTEETLPGTYEVAIEARPEAVGISGNGAQQETEADDCAERTVLSFFLRVGNVKMDKQKLIHTEWFHGDCLAAYYHVEPLSEAHWAIMERFIRQAGRRHGVNMLLTPVFTPPLDTEVGGERPTVQLVGITGTKGKYSFDFSALARWTAICRENGIEYLEIAHLFTQWGARATPKIIACIDGENRRIFGWDVPADSPKYREFLEHFLPALQAELQKLGYDREHVYFHISDEPSEENKSSYLAAKKQAADLLSGYPVIDALSSFSLYQTGIVEHPAASNDHIQSFIDAQVPDLWVYYCCAQGIDVPNRFYAMPSARNRIMGVLMYLYQIKGFLHWGYNFYFTQYSRKPADPYRMTHSDYAFPSGDAYLVYPGEDGEPLTSIRAEVQNEALADIRILNTLEKWKGRGEAEKIIYGEETEPFTFKKYPHSAEYLLSLREKLFDAIENG